jgi:ketosteroid isomerase-like protein
MGARKESHSKGNPVVFLKQGRKLQQIEAFAKDWIQSWNRRDVEAVLEHYTEDVEFQSSLVVMLLGETSGTVRGKQNLRDYFRKALEAFPGDLNIELLDAYQGVDSLLVHFQASGRRAVEVMELNQEGKVRMVRAFAACNILEARRRCRLEPFCSSTALRLYRGSSHLENKLVSGGDYGWQ